MVVRLRRAKGEDLVGHCGSVAPPRARGRDAAEAILGASLVVVGDRRNSLDRNNGYAPLGTDVADVLVAMR
jgi:hypothetical protein